MLWKHEANRTRLVSPVITTQQKKKRKGKADDFLDDAKTHLGSVGRSMFLISSRSCLDSSGDGKRKEGKKKQCAISNDCPVLSMLKRTRGMLFGFLTAAPVDCCRPAALLVCLFTDKLLDPYSIVRPQITSPEGLI